MWKKGRGGVGEEKCETTDQGYFKTRIATEYEFASETRKCFVTDTYDSLELGTDIFQFYDQGRIRAAQSQE